MPDDIRAYLTRDGREVPCLGTLIRDEDILHFSQLPDGLKFYLASTGIIMTHFVRLNRWLPAEHPAVKAYLWVLLKEGRRRRPTKEEFDFYWQRCLASSLNNPLSDEQAVWCETVVLAIEELMYLWFHHTEGGGTEYRGKLMVLRKKLVDICEAQGWSTKEWAGGNHFHDYLEERRPLLRAINIELEWPDRTATLRGVILRYIDPARIPPDRNRNRT
jgi:hypothetical protein